MLDCLIRQVGEIGKCIFTQCLWPPMSNAIVPFVKRNIDYWWCFDDNIRNLERQIDRLERRIKEAARLRTEEALLIVEKWSKEGTEKLGVARTILDSKPKAWNLISRYSMGKRAKKAAENIAEHGKPRIVIEEEILESLRLSTVDLIAICGVGGVGKTAMAEKIKNRVIEKYPYYEVVMVTVSKKKEMSKIQEEIAEMLDLKFDVTCMPIRAEKLRTRLKNSYKILIIFDDVWENLKLEDLGVPYKSERGSCKILLTTQRNYVCAQMQAKIITMEILTKEEAWILFKEQAGHCVEDLDLLSVAKDVVAECKGLPIALITVGKALENQEKSIWEHLLLQLRRSKLVDFPIVLEDFMRLLN